MVAGRLRSSSPRSFAAVRLEAARGGGGGPAPDRGSACKLSSGGSFAKPGCAPGSRRALSESHARGGGRAGRRGVNGVPGGSYTWPVGLMDKAVVFGIKDCRLESCQGHACAFVGPAACPRKAARCHLGPRQRAGARRGRGGASGRHARNPKQARGSSGPPQARPDQGPGGAFRARRSRSHKTAACWIAWFYEEITHERRPSSEGGGSCPKR